MLPTYQLPLKNKVAGFIIFCVTELEGCCRGLSKGGWTKWSQRPSYGGTVHMQSFLTFGTRLRCSLTPCRFTPGTPG